MFALQPVNIVAGVCFIVGGALMAGAVDVAMLVVGRIFLGFGVGLCSLVSFDICLLACSTCMTGACAATG